jgi:phosphoglycerate kinase
MSALLDKITPLDQMQVASRRVLVRVDFDVPLTPDGRVSDDARVREAMPTIKHLVEQGARVIIASHIGRGKKGRDAKLSLAPAGERLAEFLSMDVVLTDECVGDGARKVVHDLRDGRVALLENLRAHSGEESNDPSFAAELAQLCDVYVGDAFGASHLAHASVDALPRMVPNRAAGLLFMKELKGLGGLMTDVKRPVAAVLGGARLSDKVAVFESLLGRVEVILVGGALANTFLAAQGRDLGASLLEPDKLALARTLLEKARARRVQVVLPTDVVVATGVDSKFPRVVGFDDVGPGHHVLDIGPATVAAFRSKLLGARSIFWNGPMGYAEGPLFAEGTVGVARAIAEAAAYSVISGGDTVAAVTRAGLTGRFSHISTGGDASLALLEGRKLPGVEALRA